MQLVVVEGKSGLWRWVCSACGEVGRPLFHTSGDALAAGHGHAHSSVGTSRTIATPTTDIPPLTMRRVDASRGRVWGYLNVGSGRRPLTIAPWLVIILAGAFACSSNPGAPAVTTTEQVLKFPIHGYEDHAVDVGEHGRSPGDTFYVQYELWNSDETAKVGDYATACVLERDYGEGPDLKSLNRCTATAFLETGTIELAARILRADSEKSLRYSIIGGTDSYKNAVGEATVVFGDEDAGTPDTLEIDLTTPRL